MQNVKITNSAYDTENIINIQHDKQQYKGIYSAIQRNELFIWMANASEAALCEIMKNINPSPYKKLLGPEKARLHALLAAAEAVRSAAGLTGRKNHERNLAALDEAHATRIAMLDRPGQRRSPKREKVALHEGVIRQLFARGYSLRQACTYLKRYAGLDVNHSYLRQCCREMGIEAPGKPGVAYALKETQSGEAYEESV